MSARQAIPQCLPVSSFNDDDVYVYNAATKQIVRVIGSKDSQVRDSRYIGLRVQAGESWARGMAAKSLGLWRESETRAAPFVITAADREIAESFAPTLEVTHD
jgi:hypothetical protein